MCWVGGDTAPEPVPAMIEDIIDVIVGRRHNERAVEVLLDSVASGTAGGTSALKL